MNTGGVAQRCGWGETKEGGTPRPAVAPGPCSSPGGLGTRPYTPTVVGGRAP